MSNYHIKHLEEYYQVYRKSIREPESFWEEIAEEHFLWRKKWDTVLDWDFSKPEISWFKDFKTAILDSGLKKVLPNATSIENGVKLYEAFPHDEGTFKQGAKKFGVLRMKFNIIKK